MSLFYHNIGIIALKESAQNCEVGEVTQWFDDASLNSSREIAFLLNSKYSVELDAFDSNGSKNH